MAPTQTCTPASWLTYTEALLSYLHPEGHGLNGYCRPEINPQYVGIAVAILVVSLTFILTYMQSRHKFLSDVRLAHNFIQVVTRLAQKSTWRRRTFTNCFKDAVRRWPNKIAIEYIDDGRKLTFKEVDLLANKLANVFTDQGLQKGDVAALYMTNKPEYIAIELALAKLGVVSALLNYNIKGRPLTHSVSIADAKLIVFDTEHAENIRHLHKEMPNVKLLALGQGGNELTFAKWLDDLLNKASDSPPNPSICRDISQEAVLSLVYTSGTTGLPKAAIIKQKRIYLTSMGFAKQFNVGKKDRIYCTLPLYHSSGGTLGLGMMINCGATLVLRSKFSARNFFKDVHDSKATVTQYIDFL